VLEDASRGVQAAQLQAYGWAEEAEPGASSAMNDRSSRSFSNTHALSGATKNGLPMGLPAMAALEVDGSARTASGGDQGRPFKVEKSQERHYINDRSIQFRCKQYK
jgi:hypothetical protein